MKTRLYDAGLGFVLGLSLMGLFAIWQADQIRRYERLYAEQDFEIKVHRDFATAKATAASRLRAIVCQQQEQIAELGSQLEQSSHRVLTKIDE